MLNYRLPYEQSLRLTKQERAALKLSVMTNEAAHTQPKIGKRYGHKFGSKLIKKLFQEDDVPMVEYETFTGVVQKESLTMFNRWATRSKIIVP